jgi:hypothetical protein
VTIEEEHMIRALARWKDFEAAQVAETTGLEEPERGLKIAEGLRAQGEGLGLTDDAKAAYYRGMAAILRSIDPPPEGTLSLESAAYMGLSVGLTAAELASEDREQEPKGG